MLNITTGVEKMPIKTVIYGAEGVGKSSLAAKFPNALFLDTEGGTTRLDVRRIKINGWEELLDTVKEVIANPEVCKSLVIDTADWRRVTVLTMSATSTARQASSLSVTAKATPTCRRSLAIS